VVDACSPSVARVAIYGIDFGKISFKNARAQSALFWIDVHSIILGNKIKKFAAFRMRWQRGSTDEQQKSKKAYSEQHLHWIGK
jgi:hypothetical protein